MEEFDSMDIGKLGIIGGAGWLGSAIAARVCAAGGLTPDQLICSYRSTLPNTHPECAWTTDNDVLVATADIIILSVRPQDWPAVKIDATSKLVISVMAGVSLKDIAAQTGSERVARALPNAAAAIGYGFTPYILASQDASDPDRIEAIFGCCGLVDRVFEEDHIDYLTAMSGSGAAFPALLADAMATAAMNHGLPEALARRGAEQLLIGAGRLQETSGVSVSQTVQSFVDYNGTTAAGIRDMLQNGFDRIVDRGLEAAYRRALSMVRDQPC
jgi:pyrroline-5-carboxylate reductase